jgi:hypothetical protein
MALPFISLPLFIYWVILAWTAPGMAAEAESWPRSILKFTGGLASGALIHEGTHALVAGLTGTHLTWEVGTYNQPIGFTDHAESDAKSLAVYSAGFIAQVGGGGDHPPGGRNQQERQS